MTKELRQEVIEFLMAVLAQPLDDVNEPVMVKWANELLEKVRPKKRGRPIGWRKKVVVDNV